MLYAKLNTVNEVLIRRTVLCNDMPKSSIKDICPLSHAGL